MPTTLEKQWLAALAILCFCVFFIIYTSPSDYSSSDAHGSLLTAQAILEHGTTRLDAYRDKISGYQFVDLNGHLYYKYPLGTSLITLPVVWALTLQGDQFWSRQAEHDVQKGLAALTVTILCVLLFCVCRYYLGVLSS